MSVRIDRRKLILTEGTHDEGVAKTLLDARKFGRDEIQFLHLGGKTELFRTLRALILDARFPDVLSIAIIRDADASPPGNAGTAAAIAFEAVCGCLRNCGLPIPKRHGEFCEGPPRTGIFIMPNGTDDGMLEDLCVESVANLPHFTCVREYFDCLSRNHVVPENRAKAWASAFIASCKEPDVHVGVAARNGYWSLTHRVFDDFFRFMASQEA